MRLGDIVLISIWIGIIFVFGVAYLNFQTTGKIFFDIDVILLMIANNPIASLLLLLTAIGVIYAQFRYYRRNLLLRRNCQIQYVELEKIAISWLENEEIEKNIEFNLKSQMEKQKERIEEEDVTFVDIILDRKISDLSFFKKYVRPHWKAFTDKELSIVMDLYEFLEVDGKNTSSVGMLYSADSDLAYKDKVNLSGILEYEVLAKVNLFDHTLDVVEIMYNHLAEKEKNNFAFLYPKCLIISLAHDIGKIANGRLVDDVVKNQNFYTKHTHETISKYIMKTMYGDYKDIDIVCTAIESHHIKHTNKNMESDKYTELLLLSDKGARKKEISDYAVQQKKLEKENMKDASTKIEEKIREEIKPVEAVIATETAVVDEVKPVEAVVKNTIESNVNEILLNDDLAIDNMQAMGELITLIANSSNTIEEKKASGLVKIISVSHKDKILVPKDQLYRFFTKVKINSKDNSEVENVIAFLKNDGVFIKYVFAKIDKFSNPTYKGLIEYALIDATVLGLTETELELQKRNNPYLRNIEVNY